MTRVSLQLAALTLLSACAGAGAQVASPDETLEAYTRAVRAGDAEAVYALLDDEARANTDIETIRAQIADAREELSDQADAIDRARGASTGPSGASSSSSVDASAQVMLDDGERVVLVIEEGRWRILGGVMNAPSMRNPRDAVMAFRRAIQRRSLPGVLRVLARGQRTDLEQTLQTFLDDTEDELDMDYELDGNDAIIRTSTGRTIRLVRESGEWRIVSIE